MVPVATAKVAGDTFILQRLVDPRAVKVLAASGLIYAFAANEDNPEYEVVRGEVLRIGSPELFKTRFESGGGWMDSVTKSLQGKSERTPSWKADAWKSVLAGHPMTIYAKRGTIIRDEYHGKECASKNRRMLNIYLPQKETCSKGISRV
jgi:hypothetical protein